MKLNDGITAYFGKDHFYTLTFIKDDLEFCYALDKNTYKNKEVFLEIVEKAK